MDEAKLDETPYGRNPAGEGWFVLNLADALAVRNEEKGGAIYPLEPEGGQFADFGVNVHVVWPGEPSALYHSENAREAFLVLSGECTLLVARAGRGCGFLALDVRREPPRADGQEDLLIEVEVANFYPSIASGISQRLYDVTQSRMHVIITHSFLRSLRRLDLAESRVGRLAEIA